MRTINVVFEDKEYDQLTKLKKETSWHDFLLRLSNKYASKYKKR